MTQLRDVVDRTLSEVLDGVQSVALVNFPNHGNPGDPAIWLGTLRVLERLGCQVRYQSNYANFDAKALDRAHPTGPVLINGGGNFGDMYAGQQGLREQLFRELCDRRIVQLPQSIHFREEMNVERIGQLIAAHGNVTLMLREQASLDSAQEFFDADLVSCPDMAFGLGPLSVSADPQFDVTWIVRSQGDPEWNEHGPMPACPPSLTIEEVDWTGTLPDDQARWTGRPRRVLTLNRMLMNTERKTVVNRWGWRVLASTFEPLANEWVDRGTSLLGRGRVVVTDRLHGHILSLLLGMPHVILDNSTGKVRSTYDTWTSLSPNVAFAESSEDALSAAIRFLNGGSSCSS